MEAAISSVCLLNSSILADMCGFHIALRNRKTPIVTNDLRSYFLHMYIMLYHGYECDDCDVLVIYRFRYMWNVVYLILGHKIVL